MVRQTLTSDRTCYRLSEIYLSIVIARPRSDQTARSHPGSTRIDNWGERERAPSCGLKGRAVMHDIAIYIYVRHPLLRMRGATRKRSRPDRELSQSS